MSVWNTLCRKFYLKMSMPLFYTWNWLFCLDPDIGASYIFLVLPNCLLFLKLKIFCYVNQKLVAPSTQLYKEFDWLSSLFWPIRFNYTFVSNKNNSNVKPDWSSWFWPNRFDVTIVSIETIVTSNLIGQDHQVNQSNS